VLVAARQWWCWLAVPPCSHTSPAPRGNAQLGIDRSGKMGANAREQMEMAFENVKAAVASVGASFEHVVKLNNYIVDMLKLHRHDV
jgi:hypothetical protein